ncbi:hypothetical protein HanIR_Chr07g0328741 [Helianthus annuus]|nr:hypothetical protein HanIR_Chr07g0328741 [Helianthus annuus]
MSTVNAPPSPRSSAVMGSPLLLLPITIFPRRSLMSDNDVVSAKTAIISLATDISKPVSLTIPFSSGPWPTVIFRKKRSLTSMTRLQVMLSGSMSSLANLVTSSGVKSSGLVLVMLSFFKRRNIMSLNARLPSLSGGHNRLKRAVSFCVFSWKIRVSMAAARRLFAAVIAWMSPVKWRLNSSIGMT